MEDMNQGIWTTAERQERQQGEADCRLGPTALWARESTRYCRWYSWCRAQAEKGVSCGAGAGATHWRKYFWSPGAVNTADS